MGQITIPGYKSGTPYTFNIGGDAPTDEDLAFMRQHIEQNEAQYESLLGGIGYSAPEVDTGSALGRGWEAGKANFKSTFGTTLETAGEQFGWGWLDRYGEGLEQQAQIDRAEDLGTAAGMQPMMDWRDVSGPSSGLTYIGEQLGMQGPQIGAALGTGAATLGAIAAAPVTVPAGVALTAAGALSGAASFPQLFGANVQRQEGEVEAGNLPGVDVNKAFTTALGQTALEGISNAVTGGVLGGLLKGTKIPARVGLSIVANSGAEGATEVGQAILERQQAGLPIDTPEAYAEILDNAVAGLTLGGLFGGAAAISPTAGGAARDIDVEEPSGATDPTPAAPTAVEQLDDGTITSREANAEEQALIKEWEADETVEGVSTAVAAPAEPTQQDVEQSVDADTVTKIVDSVIAEQAEAGRIIEPVDVAVQYAGRIADELGRPVSADEVISLYEARKDAQSREAASPEVAAEIEQTRAATSLDAPKADAAPVESTAESVKDIMDRTLSTLSGETPALREEVRSDFLWGRNYTGYNPGKLSLAMDRGPTVSGGLADMVPLQEEVTDAAQPEAKGITIEALDAIGFPKGHPAYRKLASGLPQEEVRPLLNKYRGGKRDEVQELLRGTSAEQGAGRGSVPATGQGVEGRGPGTSGRAGGPAGAGTSGVGAASGNVLAPPRGATGGSETLAQRAAPGATTGAAGQVIPAGIPGTEYTPPPAQRYDPVSKRVVARREPTEIEQRIEQAAARTETREKAQAVQDFAAWRTKKVPPLVRALSRDYDEGMGRIPDITTARDRRKILDVLNKLPQWDMSKRVDRTKRLTEQEFAAGRYFLRNENPMHALELIAHDAVYGSNVADPEKELRDMKRSGKAGEAAAKRLAKQAYSVPKGMDLNSPEVQYHRFTGRSYATLAREWIDANLSQDVKDYVKQVVVKNNADLSREFNYYHRMSNPDNDVTTVPRGLASQQRYKDDAQRRQAKADLFKAAERAAADYDLQARVNKAGVSLPAAPPGLSLDFLTGLNPHAEFGGPLHVTVKAALARNDLRGALRALALTAHSPYIRQMANSLSNFTGNTKVYLEGPGDAFFDLRMARDNSDIDSVDKVGAYTLMTPADIEADSVVAEKYNDSIVLNANAVTPHALLHEAVHMTTAKAINDTNDPMTRALNKLYEEVKPALQNYYGGKENLKEFLAEGLSNPIFRAELDRYRPGGSRITGLDRFLAALRNLVRRITGREPRATDSALNEFDRMVHQVLAPSPGFAKSYDISFMTQDAAKQMLGGVFKREVPFNANHAKRTISMMVSDNIPEYVKSFTLGMIPLLNLSDMAAGVFGKELGHKLLDIANRMSAELRGKHELIDNSLKPVANWFKSVNRDAQRDMIRLAHQATLNEVNMNRGRKYYEDRNEAAKLEVYDQLLPMWNRLQANGGVAEYNRLRNTFEELRKYAQDAFFDRMKRIEKDPQRAKSLYDDLVKKVFAEHLIDPYTPLTREGDYWLTYWAKDPINGNRELFKQSFTTIRARAAAYDRLQQAALENPEADILQIEVYNNVRDPKTGARPALPPAFAQEIMSILETNKVGQDAQSEVIDLILDTIPERSFLNSFRARKDGGIRGFGGDVTPIGNEDGFDFIGTMHGKLSGMARQVARMKYSAKAQEFRKELFDVTEKLTANPSMSTNYVTALQRELDMRADMIGRIDRASWSRDITGGLFFMTLGFNLSSAVVNMFALPTMVLGTLGGEYGMVKSSRAMAHATKLIAASGRTRTVDRVTPDGQIEQIKDNSGRLDYSFDNYDFDAPENADIAFYKYLAEEANARNQLHRSLAFEMADIDETTSTEGFGISKRAKWDKLRGLSGSIFHHSERYARETTLLTAYQLELEKMANGGDIRNLKEAQYREAADKAVYLAELTNSSVAATAAPRWAQGNVGSILLMYKRYMLAMAGLQMTQLKQAFSDADPEMRRQAKRQLAYTYGLLTAFSGVAGTPIYGLIENVYNSIFDDEDEEDFDTIARTALGELGFKGALNYVTGREMASRIGLQDMFYREPVVEQGWPWDMIVGIGGPSFGMALNTKRGIDLLAEGEILRGVEALSPAAIRNLVRGGIRYPSEGARTMRGDPVVDDIGVADMIGQAIGFAPARYVQQLEMNAQYKEIDKAIAAERSKLMKSVYTALRDRNYAEARRLYADIADFNRENPQYPILPENLQRSLKQHEKTSQQMKGGVTYNPANIALLQKMQRAWGEPTIWGG